MTTQSKSEGGWPGGWAVAAATGVIAMILTRAVGQMATPGAVVVGLVVFLVFGVLLGLYWTTAGAHAGHGADDHPHGADHHGAAAHPVVSYTEVAAPGAEPALAHSAEISLPADRVAAPEAHSEPMAGEHAAALVADVGASKPEGLSGPRGGKADDLQTIEGIGPVLEKLCHELGIYHFDQIAAWGAAEIAWMDGNIKGFKGRTTRDKWVAQARLIGTVGRDEFLVRAKTNDY